MHGYDPHYGPPPPPPPQPPSEMYPSHHHPDLPLMLPMPPYSQEGGSQGHSGNIPNFHEGGLGALPKGPGGEDFGVAAFPDPDCQIESKG